jgi:hypothetical protein
MECQRETVIAYADDVNVITKPQDIHIVREETKQYEKASGAKINIQKSPRNGDWGMEIPGGTAGDGHLHLQGCGTSKYIK